MKLKIEVTDRITSKGEIKPHVTAFLSTGDGEQIIAEKNLPEKAARLVELSGAVRAFVENFYMKYKCSSSSSSESTNTLDEPSTT